MIRLGVRLAVAGGREAAVRLAVIAAAVAIGVALLLSTFAGVNAVNTQNARYAWLNTTAQTPGSGDPLWWSISDDYFHGQDIGRIDVAATGPSSPIPPGLPRLPGPGEFYASPALAALLATEPADQLAARYPGHEVGIIGPAALPGPNSLIIIIGRTPTEMAAAPDAAEVRGIATIAPSDCIDCFVGVRSDGIDLILGVVAGALLFPLLIFIGSATRLSATRRENRFAAMRLVGATPRQVSLIATVESALSAVAGAAVGFGLFYSARVPLAHMNFTGTPFYPGDLALNWIDALVIAIGVPLAAAVAARLALRRVRISPLGVSRHVTPPPPRAWRLIPLAVGLAELAWFIGRRPHGSLHQVYAYLSGFLVMTAGLVIAGPWLTMIGARLMARRTSKLATLIAARRLGDNPKAGFRAVSGLILALFIATSAVAIIGSIDAHRSGPTNAASTHNVLTFVRHGASAPPAALASVPGVTGVVTVHLTQPQGIQVRSRSGPPFGPPPHPDSLALCSEIAQDPNFGTCQPGAEVAWVWIDLQPEGPIDTVWPAAPMTAAQLATVPIVTVIAGTDGTSGAIERARTVLMAAYPQHNGISTAAEDESDSLNLLRQWQQLADVVIVASLVIAGCSLAVSVAGGVNERKRPFSLLRLTGVPLGALRTVLALETAVPLCAAAVVAIGAGLLAAQLFLRAQLQYSVIPMPGSYYAVVGAGILISLGIIASTMPLLQRITGPETARNE